MVGIIIAPPRNGGVREVLRLLDLARRCGGLRACLALLLFLPDETRKHQRGDEGRDDDRHDEHGEDFVAEGASCLACCGEDQADLTTGDHGPADDPLVGIWPCSRTTGELADDRESGHGERDGDELRVREHRDVDGHACVHEEDGDEEAGRPFDQVFDVRMLLVTRFVLHLVADLVVAFEPVHPLVDSLSSLRLLELAEVHGVEQQPSREGAHDGLHACEPGSECPDAAAEEERDGHLHAHARVDLAQPVPDVRGEESPDDDGTDEEDDRDRDLPEDEADRYHRPGDQRRHDSEDDETFDVVDDRGTEDQALGEARVP